MVKASTCGGADASLLDQHLDGRLALTDSLHTSARARLACILSAEEAFRDLGTFAFVVLHLFSAGGWHSSAIAKLLRLIKRLEELQTEVQGVISSPNLATTLLVDVSRRWSLYLNRYVAASTSGSLDALVFHVPFLLNPILSDMEGGRYMEPIITASLADLIHNTGGRGGSGGGGGGGDSSGDCVGDTTNKRKASTAGEDARVPVRYDAQLPDLSLRDGENSCSILEGTVLTALHGGVLCNN